MRLFIACLLLVVSPLGQTVEPMTVEDLARSFNASRIMSNGEAGSVSDSAEAVRSEKIAYRAGRFDGYLLSLGEQLQARGEICLPACFCHVRDQLDPQLEVWLADPALDRAQPAHRWLAARLRATYPCPAK